MQQEQIQRKAPKRPKPDVAILPLDPRDPDIVRAKELRDLPHHLKPA